jgi:hypothetical protein
VLLLLFLFFLFFSKTMDERNGEAKREKARMQRAAKRRIAFFDSPRVKDEHPDARALFYEEI